VTSVGDVKLVLEQSCERLREVYRAVRDAQGSLDEAVEVLVEAWANHPESLVPAGFVKAGERFAEELELIVSTLELVQRLAWEL
jgi:hypothetical protein